MMHTKKCPYCTNVVGEGHGDPLKHLGSPLKRCSLCGYTYIDSDMIEWAISPWYRKLAYCFANNRIWYCLMPALFLGGMSKSLLIFMIVFIFIFAVCCAYVKVEVDEEIEISKERVKDVKYVETLIASGYPVKAKK